MIRRFLYTIAAIFAISAGVISIPAHVLVPCAYAAGDSLPFQISVERLIEAPSVTINGKPALPTRSGNIYSYPNAHDGDTYTVDLSSLKFQQGYTANVISGITSSGKIVQPGVYGSITARAIEYKITYDLDGGEFDSSEKANPTTYTTQLSFTLNPPHKDGYVFTGWTGTGISGESAQTDVTVPAGSIGEREYTAHWSKQITITYNANGGEGTMSPSIVTDGAKWTAPECEYTRKDSSFYGWSTNPNASTDNIEYKPGQEYTWNADNSPTLYAVWGAKRYTVTIPTKISWTQMNIGSVDASATYDTTVSGDFDGILYLDRNSTNLTGRLSKAALTTAMSENETVLTGKGTVSDTVKVSGETKAIDDYLGTATYTSRTSVYAIIPDANGGTGSMSTLSTENGKVEAPECSYTRTGYTFTGWNTKKDGTGKSYAPGSTIQESYGLLYAQWRADKYSITYNLNGGSASGNTQNPSTYTIEDDVKLAAPTRDGYEFIGWTGSNDIGTGAVNGSKWTLTGGDSNTYGGNDAYIPVETGKKYRFYVTTKSRAGVMTPVIGVRYYFPTANGGLTTSNGNGTDGWWGNPNRSNDYNSAYGVDDNGGIERYVDCSPINGAVDAKMVVYLWQYAQNRGGLTTLDAYDMHVVPGTGDVEIPTGTTGSKTYTAHWRKKTRTIIFDANGGTGSMSSIEATPGSTITLPSSGFTRSGYTFYGWGYNGLNGYGANASGNTSYDGTRISAGGSYRVPNGNGVTILHAQWVKGSGAPSTIRYAVSIYGIEKDVDSNGKTMGLTFGSASGPEWYYGNNDKTYMRYHESVSGVNSPNDVQDESEDAITGTSSDTRGILTGSDAGTTAKGNPYRCVHYDNWNTIIYWNKTDPHVYDKCVKNRCSKRLEITPNGVTVTSNDARPIMGSEADVGDGRSFINSRSWNVSGSGNITLNGNGYSASNIRAMLVGADSLTKADGVYASKNAVSAYTSSTSYLSCFPNNLQDAIGAKDLIAADRKSGYRKDLPSDYGCYDKLWLLSAAEMYRAYNDGTYLDGWSDNGGSQSRLYTDNDRGNIKNRQCGEYRQWSRSPWSAAGVWNICDNGGNNGIWVGSAFGVAPGFSLSE